MSLNYAFGFSLLLLLMVILNIYFFYKISAISKRQYLSLPNKDLEEIPNREVFEYLNYLPDQYKKRNSKYAVWQRNIINSFNYTKDFNIDKIWTDTVQWTDVESLFPDKGKQPGQLLHAIRHSKIIYADNAPKGTQLKLLLLLEDKHKLYFKPKRYNADKVIFGNIYAGFDRHNSEILGYYLAMVMNLKWVAPAITRMLNIERDLIPVAAAGLKKTLTKNDNGTICVFGMCHFCNINDTVCTDKHGEIEGAAIIYLDKQFKIYKSPWRRSYNTKKMEWENDNNYCKKAKKTLSLRRLLDLIDTSIFDFLIQNGDRHRYEVYKDKVILLDNGKGLGNPWVDEFDILAPLYQCCILRQSTWKHMEMLSGGTLTETIKILASFQNEKLAADEHYDAIERRLLKVYATVQMCIGKYGSARVFKTD